MTDQHHHAHPPHEDGPLDHTARPAAFGLVAMAAAFGMIGMALGFATLLGVTATASGGHDTTGYGPAVVSAVSSFFLGVLLVAGAVLVWRAHRAARIVIWIGVILLVVSSLLRIAVDSITFMSVVGTVLSLVALAAMVSLLYSDGVREHLRRGQPLRLG